MNGKKEGGGEGLSSRWGHGKGSEMCPVSANLGRLAKLWTPLLSGETRSRVVGGRMGAGREDRRA